MRRLPRAAARAAGPRASASPGRAAEPRRSALEVPGAVDGGCTSSARDTDTSARPVPLRVVPRDARRGYRGAGAASVTRGADNLLRGVPPADQLCCCLPMFTAQLAIGVCLTWAPLGKLGMARAPGDGFEL